MTRASVFVGAAAALAACVFAQQQMPAMPCTFSTEYVETMTYRASASQGQRLLAGLHSNVPWRRMAAREALLRRAPRGGVEAAPELHDYSDRLMWYMVEDEKGNQEMDNTTYIWEAPATYTLASPFFDRYTCVRLESKNTPPMHCPQFPTENVKHDRVDWCANQRDKKCDVWVWWSSDYSMTQEAFMFEGTNVLDLVTIETEDYTLREDFIRMNTSVPDSSHFKPPKGTQCTDLTTDPSASNKRLWYGRNYGTQRFAHARLSAQLAQQMSRGTVLPRRKHSRPALPQKKAVPESFDARKQWPQCATVQSIRDQGHCGSCWAFGAAEAYGDRYCVASNRSVVFSPQHMVDCYKGNSGCMGGMLDVTWYALADQGVVTDACKPYTAVSHACSPLCNDTAQSKPVYYRARNAYSVFVPFDYAATVRAIQQEIMARGPVEAAFYVMSDFYEYSGGVYHRTRGAQYEGGHAVKIIGWGEENGTPYWTVANSWGTEWGEGGFFRIRRGTNECGIESEIACGEVEL